mgnify:CR=1 FL=1
MYQHDQLPQETKGKLRNLDSMRHLDNIDIDAGRVDDDLTSRIVEVSSELEENKSSLGALTMSNTVFYNSIMYSTSSFELLDVARELSDLLDDDAEERAIGSIDSLLSRATLVEELFPREPNQFDKKAKEAFGESVTSIMYTLAYLKRGDDKPTTIKMRYGDDVELTEFTFEKALEVVDSISESVSTIFSLVDLARYSFGGVSIEKLEGDGEYGIYRLTRKDGQQVLRKIRTKKATEYDDKIEYGGVNGVEPTIGFVIDGSSKEIAQYKKTHKSPLSIRVDNEGDTLALDIGSVLSGMGTLDKEAADLIAIGDSIRSGIVGKEPTLHHNARPFVGSGLEDPETFKQISERILKVLDAASSR